MSKPNLLERAFTLARAGPSIDLHAIRALLKREGYENVDANLKSASLAKQLRAICKARSKEGQPVVLGEFGSSKG